MLAQLVAIGLFSGSPSGIGPITDTGTVVAAKDCTAVILAVQAGASLASGIALGAIGWSRPYDPADHAPYAMDFAALLGSTEKIAEIEAMVMSATAALLGVEIDITVDYSPIIDTAGKKVQMWFVADEGAWADIAFNVNGVLLPVTVRVATDSTPPKRYERTSVLTVRQL